VQSHDRQHREEVYERQRGEEEDDEAKR